MSNQIRENTPEDEKILSEATDRFERLQQDDKDNRDNYKEDINFVYTPGKQWPQDVREMRGQWKEPCLEFNQLKQFTAQVVNDQRQNRPGIRIFPASGEASKQTADIIQGMIRNIEYESNAEAAYDNAFQSAVDGGRGAWRVCSDYSDDDSFNQKLCIKPINDMLTVLGDLNYQQPDGSDRNYIFVTEKMEKDQFLSKYPKAKPMSWDNVEGCWAGENDNQVILCDYYRRVCETRTLVQMSDGVIGFKDDMPPKEEWPEGVEILREREVETYKVEWFTIAGGQQILARYDWPGSIIPVVIVPGEDKIIDGKRCYQGLIRHARDAQTMLNYGMTQQAMHLALTPRAPWLIAEGQNEGYENMWRDANQRNWSALVYKPTTLEGQIVAPPQRTQPSMPDIGWERFTMGMTGMIKSTIGMYENSLGQRGQEQSGKAIIAREAQGDNATFNFFDNLSRGIALTGRILLEAIPTYYDTEQIVQTIAPDDTRKMVVINQEAPSIGEGDNPIAAIKNNDITRGKFAVTCEAGPSYATKRQQTSDQLMQLVQAFPPVAQVAGDLIVKSLNIADADVIAERLKATLPPQVLEAEKSKEGGQKPVDPQIQAAMQEKDQQLQQAVQTMGEMEKRIKELESGAQEKLQAAQTDMQIKQAQMQQDAEMDMIRAQIDAETTLNKARLEAQTKLEVAKISAETDIIIAGLTTPPELSANGQVVPSQEIEDENGSQENIPLS